jgi:hypothetical protein
MRYRSLLIVMTGVLFVSASSAGETTSPGPLMLPSIAMLASDHHDDPPPPRSKRCPPDSKDDHGDSKGDHQDKDHQDKDHQGKDHGDKDHRDDKCGKGDDSKN